MFDHTMVMELDRSEQIVRIGDNVIMPTPTQWAILMALAEVSPAWMSATDIAFAIWGSDVQGEPRWHIGLVRKQGIPIEHRKDYGYRIRNFTVTGERRIRTAHCKGHKLCDGNVVRCVHYI